ncbi:hypothetical protein [Streptomyces silvensis]|uniref:Uncharacterized protein n=1 Tax=Streptomyces silvensis TaxID=1765722 RepID=A0A0W7XAY9_9ACTN|nr:hypothetical protein [Streptomyces silvensis]KUF20169.1 hypothetical protein AT728_40290 [Streptomyces silvensis]
MTVKTRNHRSASRKTETMQPVSEIVTTTHPRSGLRTSYRVTVSAVERAEVVSESGVAVGLAARLTIQDGPGRRPVTIMASRLIGEGDWYTDAMTERGGRVHRSRGFGNRQGSPRRLLSDVADMLTICAYDARLIEQGEPGQPLKLTKVRAKRKKAATQA